MRVRIPSNTLLLIAERVERGATTPGCILAMYSRDMRTYVRRQLVKLWNIN